jgi:predicted flap endonuclease-1-like 5' DNA nuclease
MFKEYKAIFKDLRKAQDKFWQDAMASFPGAGVSRGMERWQQDTLDVVNKLLDQTITQSLDLQREWLSQWAGRASGDNLKPKTFAELSAEAQRSTQRWLENQNQLWNHWLQLVAGAETPADIPDFADWTKTLDESMQAQMKLLEDWSQITDFKSLSGKEFSKLSNQIVKAMDKSITTQQQLWSQWFDHLEEASNTGGAPAAAKPAPDEEKGKARVKPKTSKGNPKVVAHDLKQIKGIGPGLEKKLKESGIETLHDLAQLSDSDLACLEDEVIRLSGRIKRDKWVEQAKDLIK